MAKKLTKKMLELNLRDIVQAGESGIHVPQLTAKSFYEEGLIEVDGTSIDDYDCVLVRATQKGIDYYNETNDDTGEMMEPTEFVIETGIALPKTGRKNSAVEKYPFSQMPAPTEAGPASFLVKGTDEKLLSRVASAAAKATKSFSVETGESKPSKRKPGETIPVLKAERKFIARQVEGGVRVFRTL